MGALLLLVGFAALAMTVLAGLLLAAALQNVSVGEYIASRDLCLALSSLRAAVAATSGVPVGMFRR